MSRYRDVLGTIRAGFPAPWPSPQGDAQLIDAVAAGVRQALALRGVAARLQGAALDEPTSSSSIPANEAPLPIADMVDKVVDTLHGLPLEVHPRGQVNVNAQPSTVSLIGTLLPAIFNPNMSSDGRGAGCSHAERQIAAMISNLIGYDAGQSAGVFTFGGTGTLLYGMKLGLEKACPGTLQRGVRDKVVVLASERSHHTCQTAAGWLGIGSDQVVHVAAGVDNAIDVAQFRDQARELLAAGCKIAAIIATVGTTDAFGLDDVAGLAAVRDALVDEFQLDYRPHVHADAVIGWAWAAFNQYDDASNSLELPAPVLRAINLARPRIQALANADSLGVDFHKTGFVPYVSSLVLAKNQQDFQRIARDRDVMPYLFHSGNYHPGLFTLETTRAAGGVLSAWANLQWLGLSGLRTLIAHALNMTARLRDQLRTLPDVVVVNHENVGPVTLFRAYPPGTDALAQWRIERTDPTAAECVQANNEFNRAVHRRANDRPLSPGSAAIGLTSAAAISASGQPLVALKSYLLSPWLEPHDVQAIVDQLRWTADEAK